MWERDGGKGCRKIFNGTGDIEFAECEVVRDENTVRGCLGYKVMCIRRYWGCTYLDWILYLKCLNNLWVSCLFNKVQNISQNVNHLKLSKIIIQLIAAFCTTVINTLFDVQIHSLFGLLNIFIWFYFSFNQVTEGKQVLEKCLKLSRKLRKETSSLTEWLAMIDTEVTRRSSEEGMPTNLEEEIAWSKVSNPQISILLHLYRDFWLSRKEQNKVPCTQHERKSALSKCLNCSFCPHQPGKFPFFILLMLHTGMKRRIGSAAWLWATRKIL